MKIVCTIGPASESEEVINRLKANGMDYARINFSHVEIDKARELINKLKKLEVKIIIDTRGAEIRTGRLAIEPVYLKEGSLIEIFKGKILGDEHKFSLSNDLALSSLNVGDKIKIDDLKIVLKVSKIEKEKVLTEVLKPGLLTSNRIVFFESKPNTLSPLTKEDEELINYSIQHGIKDIVISFIKSKKDVDYLRNKFKSKINIIGKIECAEAIENLEEIISSADSIWIDRFDLGSAVGFDKVPFLQKIIIQECKKRNKEVLVASHFLESMISEENPTRAESNDIVNTILDGTDGFILAGETAKGRHPVESLTTLTALSKSVTQDKDIDLVSGTVLDKLKALGYIE